MLNFSGIHWPSKRSSSARARRTSQIRRSWDCILKICVTRHSRWPGHSCIRGGWTILAGTGVRPDFLNLSIPLPVTTPT